MNNVRISILIMNAIMINLILTASVYALSSVPNSDAWETDGPIYAVAQSGDTTYIGGSFTYVGPRTGSGVPLDTASGQPAGTFPKVNGFVYACVTDGLGGWYIGGYFTKVGDVARKNIAHILSDGTVDAAWNPKANSSVMALAVSGTTVYAGGYFTVLGGQTRNYIAALDASGAATSWNPNANGSVNTLAVSGTTIYAGGGFSTIGGQTRIRIAALDATLNTNNATAWNPNANDEVLALAVTGTTVYAGGRFTNIGGAARNRIAALDATINTNNATAWNPNANNNFVRALAVSGTTVYVGGDFTTIGGQTRNRIAALDATIDTNNATAWNPNASSQVNALIVSGTTVYTGGLFTNIGGQTRNRIAALDATLNTNNATAWNPRANKDVYSLAFSGTTVYAGGDFTSIGGQTRYFLAAFDASGAATAWNPNPNNTVYTLAASETTVYAGGYFTSIGGQARNRIAALDATLNTNNATAWNPNATDAVLALAVSGTTVYAGGLFTTIGGQTRNRIAALDATINTNNATTWNPNANGQVNALAVSGTTVYAGGYFTTIGGQTRNRIAALDATLDTNNATAWNPNATDAVLALAISETTVYAGGYFTTIGGQTRNRIAALDATLNTNNATAWNPNATDAVRALAVSGTIVYAGGHFTTIGGQTRSRIAALDATLNTNNATVWNPNADGVVSALAISGTTVYAGGNFTALGGNPKIGYAQFDSAPSNPGADSISENSIRWTWQDNSNSETGFKVYDDPGASPPSTLKTTTAANVTNWQHNLLTPNTQYSFQAAAINPEGDSAKTPNYSRYTLSGPPAAENNVTCDKAVATLYPAGTPFSFTNPAGFGVGTHGGSAYRVSKFRYAWDMSPTYAFATTLDFSPMTAAFTPPIEEYDDGNAAVADLLLHCDGFHNGTTFTDSSPNGFTVTPTTVFTDQNWKKFGTSSAYFPAAGTHLTIPGNAVFDFGTDPFMVDMWVRFPSGVSNGLTLVSKTSGGANWQFGVSSTALNKTLFFSATDGVLTAKAESGALTWVSGQTYHIAAVGYGSGAGRVFKVFRDGVPIGTSSVDPGLSVGASGGDLKIGQTSGSADACYMDEIRIKKSKTLLAGTEPIWNTGALDLSTAIISGDYYLHLQSFNEENILGGTLDYGPFKVLIAPADPTNPGATAIGTNTITWTWQDNSSDETGFKVYVDPGAMPPSSLQTTTGADATSWQQNLLSPNTQYAFQVAATNLGVDSAKTNNFATWTLAAVPSMPALSNQTQTTMQVAIGAGDGNPGGTEYAVYCSTASKYVQSDGSLNTGAVWQTAAVWGSKTVTGLLPNTSYSFAAKARNGASVETALGSSANQATDPLKLTVASACGSPTPAVGITNYNLNDSVNASVTSPVSGGADVQYVCTGYTGTGSAPSGSGNSCSFNISQDSTLTWNWTTQYQLTTAVNPAGSGSIAPANGSWHDAGTNPSIEAFANAGWQFAAWSGALGGATNPQNLLMDAPKSVTANFNPQLTVLSAYGSPFPSSTTYPVYTTTVNASVASPVSGGEGVQYVCTGWTGMGDAPSSGTGTSCAFTINTPSSITWNWKTQYLLIIETDPSPLPAGCNVIPAVDSFFDVFEVVDLQATSQIGSPGFLGWTGDVTSNNPNETITMNGPKSVMAHFAPPNTEVRDWQLFR